MRWEGSDQTLLFMFSPCVVFSSAHIISSVVHVSKSQEKVSGWLSLSLHCGDGLKKGRRRELFISSVSKKGGNFCFPSRLCRKEETQRGVGATEKGFV